MTKRIVIAVFLLGVITTSGFARKGLKDSVAYAMGIQMAENLRDNSLINRLDLPSISKALEESKKGKQQLSKEEANEILRTFFTKRHEEMLAKNLKAQKDFLEENAKKEGVQTTASGLQYKIVRMGFGEKPKATDEVEVNYKGTLIDGREFDSSYKRNESIKFPLNRVIPGWTEGLQLLPEGGKIMLYIPSELAYGDKSMPGSIIEPNSTLIFEIELIKIIKNN